MTIFLLSVTVFDDRSILAWSTVCDDAPSPIQHVGRASAQTWRDVCGSILESDRVRVCVTDRRKAKTRRCPNACEFDPLRNVRAYWEDGHGTRGSEFTPCETCVDGFVEREHTPGPWMYRATAGDHDFAVYPEATGRDVALVRDFNEANARLIAAAPEMQALLTWAVDWTRRHHASVTPEPEWDEARSLLARITEGSGN
jgi:hypothetical protein